MARESVMGLEIANNMVDGDLSDDENDNKMLQPTKRPWTEEEDRLVTRLISENGLQRWRYVASFMHGRSGKQVRERWRNQLDPSLNRSGFSEAEDDIIVSNWLKLGNQWSEIARLLQGRTDNAIKNYWNSTAGKTMRARLLGADYASVRPAVTTPFKNAKKSVLAKHALLAKMEAETVSQGSGPRAVPKPLSIATPPQSKPSSPHVSPVVHLASISPMTCPSTPMTSPTVNTSAARAPAHWNCAVPSLTPAQAAANRNRHITPHNKPKTTHSCHVRPAQETAKVQGCQKDHDLGYQNQDVDLNWMSLTGQSAWDDMIAVLPTQMSVLGKQKRLVDQSMPSQKRTRPVSEDETPYQAAHQRYAMSLPSATSSTAVQVETRVANVPHKTYSELDALLSGKFSFEELRKAESWGSSLEFLHPDFSICKPLAMAENVANRAGFEVELADTCWMSLFEGWEDSGLHGPWAEFLCT